MSDTKKIYPTLTPTAPADFSLERYNRVKDIKNELSIMKDNRNSYYKKYSKATSALQKTTIALSSIAAIEGTAGIVTSLTVVGLPVGIVLTGIGGFTGLVAAVLTPITKHCQEKKLKHAKLHSILSTGLSVLDKKLSQALNNNIIDEKEFDDLIDEYDKIKLMLNSIDVEKIKAEAKKEFTDEILQRMPSIRKV